MKETLKNRHEILFLYDVRDANPNGDPIDENKPRIDEETGINIVTDVRLKRTVRDYLADYKKLSVFVKEVKKEDGNLKTKEDRLSDLNVQNGEDLLKECIDIRLFGATAAIKKKTITYTGPVQFKFGRSLHAVEAKFVKGTTVMPSGESKAQGTFTEVYILPYSFIAFYGIANENLAAITRMTDEDYHLLLEGLWNGTKNLTSRSKTGQMPRLLFDVEYKVSNFHIGELDRWLSLESEKTDEAIRDVSDFTLNIQRLCVKLKKHADKINSLRFMADDRLTTDIPLTTEGLKSATGINTVEKLSF